MLGLFLKEECWRKDGKSERRNSENCANENKMQKKGKKVEEKSNGDVITIRGAIK